MLNIESTVRNLESRYWPLVKGWQTGLLLVTAWAGYLSAIRPPLEWSALIGLSGSLFAAISGGTVLNMWFDRDIDARMARTCDRPLSSGKVCPETALRLGAALAVLGVGWSLWLSPLFAALVLAGLFCEVVVYTVWLKRRTAWSILWGGLAGAMPILAGRALATGRVDEIGLLLAMAVLFWIPTHNLTLSMLYLEDYRRAGVPAFPAVYGLQATQGTIAISSLLSALAMSTAFIWMGLPAPILYLSMILGAGLVFFSLLAWFPSDDRRNTVLFKYASIYMLCCMVLLAVGGLATPI
jgi:protoheme IX farnesyltransferase